MSERLDVAVPRFTSSPWPDIDDSDHSIVAALQRDGRASIAKLARETGLAAAKVKSRYERLAETGLLQTVALIDPAALGRPVVAHIEVVARRGNAELAERLSSVPGVAWIGIDADYERLLVQVSTASNAELVALVNSALQSDSDVESISTAIVLRSWSPLFDYGGSARTNGSLDDFVWRSGLEPGRTLDDVDRSLLTYLEKNARSSLTTMSAGTGLSVAATRQRVLKLMDDRVIHLRTRPDARSAGVTSVRVLLETRGNSTSIAAELAAMPNVNFVSESTGPRQMSIELLCASEAQIGEGYDRACRVAGVRSARMMRFPTARFQAGNW